MPQGSQYTSCWRAGEVWAACSRRWTPRWSLAARPNMTCSRAGGCGLRRAPWSDAPLAAGSGRSAASGWSTKYDSWSPPWTTSRWSRTPRSLACWPSEGRPPASPCARSGRAMATCQGRWRGRWWWTLRGAVRRRRSGCRPSVTRRPRRRLSTAGCPMPPARTRACACLRTVRVAFWWAVTRRAFRAVAE